MPCLETRNSSNLPDATPNMYFSEFNSNDTSEDYQMFPRGLQSSDPES